MSWLFLNQVACSLLLVTQLRGRREPSGTETALGCRRMGLAVEKSKQHTGRENK